MSVLNGFALIGNLCKKPELKKSSTGKTYSFFIMGVNSGKDKTDFFGVVAWDNIAENLVKYCDKGDQIAVMGELGTTPDTNSPKDNATKVTLTARGISYLSKSHKSNEPKQIEPEKDVFKPANSDPFASF